MCRRHWRARAFVAAMALVLAGPALAGGSDPAAAPPGPAQSAPIVSALAGELHGGRLRITLTLNRPVPFHAFTLDAPRRLVLDLPAVDWRAARPAGIPWIGAVRTGLFRPGRARLVFDLARPLALARSFLVPAEPGRAPRVVLDLVPETAEAFAARAGWPGEDRWPEEMVAPPRLRIALDPGHGGRDPGAMAGGLAEKDLVLDLALRLKAELDSRPGLEAVLTREDDSLVPLEHRLAVARTAGADVMLSLHADAVAEGTAEGVSVYTLPPRAGRGLVADLLERGDRSNLIGGSDLTGEDDGLTGLLLALARRSSAEESERLAESLIDALDGAVAVLAHRPHRRGAFLVLKAADMPAALVELGFLDNRVDRERLSSPEWRSRAVEALADGIARWAEARSGRAASRGRAAPREPGE